MAPEGGRKDSALAQTLYSEPYRFSFFQVVRLLGLMSHERALQPPHWKRDAVGQDPRRIEWEIARFRAYPSLTFPPSDVNQIRPPAQVSNGEDWELPPPEIVVSFMGLTGPSGVLPEHYTRLIISRLRDKDSTFRDFLDLFNHRLISLYHRAWEKYRFPFIYERVALGMVADETEDLFTRCLFSVIGLGTAGLRNRQLISDETFLYYGGHFAHFPRCTISLENVLRDYFELEVQIEQFQGQWLYLSPEDRSLLPSPQAPNGLNTELGLNFILGERVWDVQSKFRLRLGPLNYAEFCRFMPIGDALRPMAQLTRSYVGMEFDFDVQPVLLGEEVPWFRLVSEGADGPRLGWNTWVRSKPFEHNVMDAIFSLEDV
jgi:type VI secretion system protein ImpH